jgi:hypothetical protein
MPELFNECSREPRSEPERDEETNRRAVTGLLHLRLSEQLDGTMWLMPEQERASEKLLVGD